MKKVILDGLYVLSVDKVGSVQFIIITQVQEDRKVNVKKLRLGFK